jgi:dihydroneopterin triphosphate diphosphatase
VFLEFIPVIKSEPRSFTLKYMANYKTPVSVLVAVYSTDGRFLLLERAVNPGFWQSVTGSLESDETIEQAASRELQEETGLVANSVALASNFEGAEFPINVLINHQQSVDYEIFSLWRDRYAPGVSANAEHWFSFKLRFPQVVELAPKEHRAQGWLFPAEAMNRCFSPSNQQLINQLSSREFVTKQV